MRTIRIGLAAVVSAALVAGATGCKKTDTQTAVAAIPANDPANVNMAAAGPAHARGGKHLPARVLGASDAETPTAEGESYPDAASYDAPAPPQDGMNEADQAPPALPEYAQPAPVQAGTIWTPGYWQHGPGGFFWVQGAWVAPPYQGALWTPGYWAAAGPHYRFHPGFWGRHVGYYGGIPYGNGYTGHGYYGGYWNNGRFVYNQACNHIDPNVIRDVYVQPEPVATVRASFAGPGGIVAPPIAAEMVALNEPHRPALAVQFNLERAGLHIGVGIGGGPAMVAAPVMVGPPPVVVERPMVVERPVYVERDGPPGHAYGHFKEHHDNGNHFGERKWDDDDHQGNEEHGHGEGHGHGHDK